MNTFQAGITAACIMAGSSAHAFDLQGHRGARGLAPENTLEGFAAALQVGVSTLELDLGVTRDGVVVVSHDSYLNPDHTRDPNGQFLLERGPSIRSRTLAELERYDVGRLKPGTAYAQAFPDQKPSDGARIPTLADVFNLVKRTNADHVRFNIETKVEPQSGADVADPETFAAAVVQAVRDAGLGGRVTVQSFDWRTLAVFRRLAPEIERSCVTIEMGNRSTVQRGRPGASPWLGGLDVDDFDGSVPKLVKTAGCAVWSPLFRDLNSETLGEAKALGLKVIPWTVNERSDMTRLIGLGVDGIITDYPDRLRAVMADKGLALPPAVTLP